MKPDITLGSHTITDNSGLYVIAEIGVNHEGSLETAKRLIELAKEGGAHAAKFQSYKADTLAAKNSPSYWDLTKESTNSQHKLFSKYDNFGPSEYQALAEHCKTVGIDFISTPFDEAAVQFLNPLVPFFKIASADITNTPLLRQVAATKKPAVLSTGASRLSEIKTAIDVLETAGCEQIALLHCILNYPTDDNNANLAMIHSLKEHFPSYSIGYSDHTVPDSNMFVLGCAYDLGARIIEKHFTHDKTLPGNDHYHAMNKDDLQVFIQNVRRTDKILGNRAKLPLKSEEISRKNARRSLVTVHQLQQGDQINNDSLIPKRPAFGISPVHIDKVLGATVERNLDSDHIIQFDDITLPVQKSEKTVGMIQARMGSQRFPGKMLAPLGEHPLLEWILVRVRKSLALDEIVLLTSEAPENDALQGLAEHHGVRCFRGSENNVLSRFVTAAKETQADLIVRICGDNPFISPEEVDRVVNFYKFTRPDYAFNHIPALNNQYADGFGAEVFSKEVLGDLEAYAQSPDHTEHVTKFIWENPYTFDIRTLKAPHDIAYKERFDIDTPEDLKKLQPLATSLGINASAEQYINYMKEH